MLFDKYFSEMSEINHGYSHSIQKYSFKDLPLYCLRRLLDFYNSELLNLLSIII